MKKLILSFLMIAAVGVAFSQTVFFDEDFQDVSDIDMIDNLDDAEPEQWVNLDVDEVVDNNGDVSNWYYAIGPEHSFVDGTTTAFVELDGVEDMEINGLSFPWLIEDGVEDTNFVFGSTSWLTGYADGNRNWLVLPEIELTEPAALSFKSSTAQGPRYSDGYSVWIATADYDDPTSYVELMRVAQCVPPVPSSTTTGADALDLNNGLVNHGPGTIPYNGFDPALEGMQFHLGGQDYDAASSYRGLLEPFSVDLSAYDGQTVRIAFLHDSDDDVSMDLDEILVQAVAIGLDEVVTEYYGIYPNPVEDVLNIQFTDKFVGNGVYRVLDVNGLLVARGAFNGTGLGSTERVAVSQLAAGSYTFQLIVEGEQALNTTFIKQ